MNNLHFQYASENDCELILNFIRELAEYENLSNEVVATKERLHDTLFKKKYAEVILICLDDLVIGIALYFYNYSTFLAKPGLYLEDLYIKPEYRGNGYGKQTLRYLAKIAIDNGYGRMEWNCLNRNNNSIEFYKSLGATSLDEWSTYRLNEEKMNELINREV